MAQIPGPSPTLREKGVHISHFVVLSPYLATTHLKRFNLTLRQRLPRLIRKALSFSKKLKMHLITLRRLFIYYNLDQAAKYPYI